MTSIDFGGSDRVSLNFLKNFDKNRFDIEAILLIRPWEEENIFIRELKSLNVAIHKVPVAIRDPKEGRDYFRVLRCLKIIHFILKSGSFDLMHTHGYFADIVGIPIARKLRIPDISTCHGFISNDRTLAVYNTLDRVALRFSKKIIAVSEGIKDDLIRHGIKGSLIEVIVNSVQTDMDSAVLDENRRTKRARFNIGEQDLVVGYAGRLSPEKGIRFLIEACSMLKGMGVPVKVLIIGAGPQRGELEGFAREKGLEDSVIFTGFQDDIENWMPALDFFVLPSLTEGTPMALLEAMAMGIPVIASRVGGVPKVVDSGKNGLLVSPGKPNEIKSAMLDLLRDKSMRDGISGEARKTVSMKYNIKDWARRIENEYLKVLGYSGSN